MLNCKDQQMLAEIKTPISKNFTPNLVMHSKRLSVKKKKKKKLDLGVIWNQLWPDSIIMNLVGKPKHGNHAFVVSLTNDSRPSEKFWAWCYLLDEFNCPLWWCHPAGGLYWWVSGVASQAVAAAKSSLPFTARQVCSAKRTLPVEDGSFLGLWTTQWLLHGALGSFTFVHCEVGGAFGRAELNSQEWKLEWKQWETMEQKENLDWDVLPNNAEQRRIQTRNEY